MRVLLARLLVDRDTTSRQERARLEHLGIGYLAAKLRQDGHQVEILDAELQGLDEPQMAAGLAEADYGLLGITMPDTLTADAVVGFLTQWEPPRTHERPLHFTVGGQGATRASRQLLAAVPSLDSVVRYEGEETLSELAGRLEAGQEWRATPGIAYRGDGGYCESAPRPRPDPLDALPFPARDTLPSLLAAYPNAAASVLSSRGCYRRCAFCNVNAFFGTWRARSAGNVVDELEVLARDFGVTRVDFQDDNFVGPGERGRDRARAIAAQMQQRGLDIRFRIMCSADAITDEAIAPLVEAGLYSIFIGIESGCQKRLTAYRKGTVEQNVRALQVLECIGILSKCEIGFIMFDPDGDLEEIRENLAFLREHVRFMTPGTLMNSLHDMYACMGVGSPRSLPKPLARLRELFVLILGETRSVWDGLQVGTPDHTDKWRLGVLDAASHALDALSELVGRDALTDDAYQALFAETASQAQAISRTLAS
jgi:anaerobic magnesium-protoporphyrin IX monomethyl ester cyclase